jgi:adenylate cyclase class IV
MYYIITSKKKENILVTKNYNECFDFIVKNPDAKIRTIDHTAKPRILDKRNFLKEFYKNTDDKNKFFELVEIMVTYVNNMYDLLNSIGLKEDYKTYKKVTNNTL